ncbi:MAG: cobalamin biosynthesis protein [Desulfovibrio sp.]|nr:cobalamin biosynthesis protein [Desulfovibrio sp.]
MNVFFPYSVWECWWLAPLAFLLDILFADPHLPWPHPVTLAGRFLRSLEAPARRLERLGRGRVAGLACVLILTACVGLTVWLLLALPFAGHLFAVYFAWAGLALGCLLQTGADAAHKVERAPLSEARRTVSMLVSRDVSAMDRPLLAKTLADTISENFTDAFLAPYFWLLVAGPAGLWCYKAVSTADSMWGYMTERWRWLGWASARGDDILAFVPARLSMVILWLTDRLTLLLCLQRPWQGHWPGFAIVLRQARGMPSPNSGLSMAACAWLCAGCMGGPSIYFGTLVDKPRLGLPEAGASWDTERLAGLRALLRRSGIMGAGGLVFAAYFFTF